MSIISFKDFDDDIRSIREYIKHINLTNKIVKENRASSNESLSEFCSHLSSFRTNKKILEYKAIIVSLYGILEKYINIWIRDHVDRIPLLITKYDDLPKTIRENNFQNSIKLISLISENRNAKYDGIKKEDILKKLNNCLNQKGNYYLNGEAFMPLSGNLKHSKIIEAFKVVDIDLSKKFKRNKQFVDFYKTTNNCSLDNKGNDCFKTIDDIVDLRNEVAHGSQIDNIINLTDFEDYIVFLEKYGKAIFESIIEREIEYELKCSYTEIENIMHIFKRGSVLSFEIENAVIKKGDIIIIKTQDNNFFKKKIIEIQKDKITHDMLLITQKTDIGINLGEGLTYGQKFYRKL